MRILRVVGAAVAIVAMGVANAGPAVGVSTACRVRFVGTWPSGDHFNGQVRPASPRPAGAGFVHLNDTDGTQLHLHADTLLCRRDGGIVPAHGGANIADFTGTGTMRDSTGVRASISWEIHVEDRGAGREREDYVAVRVMDANGDEVYFDANFLATGSVDLIPVTPVS